MDIQFQVINATLSDLPFIYHLFDEAIHFQKVNNYVGWNSYDKNYIKTDIENGLLMKIVHNDTIVCIFSICYSDHLIWREKEKGDALYGHRVIINRDFSGEKIFKHVMAWFVNHAKERQLNFIRIDTWADNQKLIAYYTNYGFKFIENYTTENDDNLPLQHRNLKVALLEFPIE
jgi:GNAT superfamily N-acetyltransferase